jgi:hypothetical protein
MLFFSEVFHIDYPRRLSAKIPVFVVQSKATAEYMIGIRKVETCGEKQSSPISFSRL